MQKQHARLLMMLLLMGAMPIMASCGNERNESDNKGAVVGQDDAKGGETSEQPQKEHEQLELVLYGSGFNEPGVMSEYGNPIMEKFPHLRSSDEIRPFGASANYGVNEPHRNE